MPTTPLTKGQIAKLKPGPRAFKLYDGYGLHLHVAPSGLKAWRFDCRYKGKPLLLTFGRYPEVGLEEARAAREQARLIVRAGGDPRGVRAVAAPLQLVSGDTFGDFADAHLTRMRVQGRAATTLSKAKWILGAPTEGVVGLAHVLRSKRVGTITPRDVLTVLRGIEARGRYETARRARVVISAVFRLAMIEGAATSDPTAALRGALIAPKQTHHAAIVEPKAFGGLLRAIDAYDGQLSVRAALQLAALTALRPGELRHARWEDIDFGEAVWTVPEERTKRRREHRIPISRQASEILRELRRAKRSELVFPSLRTPTKPLSENALNAALKAMGFDNHVSHGFRSSFSTLANESGLWSSDAIERQLSHLDSDSVRRAYHRGDHWEERVKLTTWWADECSRLKRKAEILDLTG